MIKCKELKKSFGTHEVLKGIGFEIPKGSIFGLLGPSGAGKTTLIKILTGQLKYDSGSVEVFGKAPELLTGADKKRFGIMMDNFGVYERFSCEDNLAVSCDIYKIPHSRIPEILTEVGLGDAVKRSASDLSKGMRTRLQLARAFLQEPEMLFLDEPTSGLDPQTMKAIHKVILEKKNEGTTIFLTTHNMQEAADLCDEVVLLNEGKIVECGRPEDICRRYDHQKKIRLHLTSGEDVEFTRNDENVGRVCELLKSGMAETIHSTEPTLETVFLELTGRRFMEEE